MIKKNKKSIICIIGMHRSGTSMIARLLSLCGLYLGPHEQLIPPNDSNPLGHFENENFTYKIDDTLLTHFGGSWDNPPLLEEGWEYDRSLEQIVNEARLLLKTFSKNSQWGWKDPRTTLLLPFWKSLIPELRFVICVRSPLEVAKSLARRDRISLQKGVYLWNQYMQAAIRDTEGCPRIFTFYEDFFKDETCEIDRLVTFCGLEKPDNSAILRDAISRELKHHTSETLELLNEDKLMTEYKIFYIGLRALTTERFVGSASYHTREALISENVGKFFKLFEQFHNEQKVVQLQSTLEDKEQQLIRIYDTIFRQQQSQHQKEEQLAQLIAQRDSLNQEFRSLQAVLLEKEQQVTQLSAEQERLAQESDKLKSTVHAQELLLNEKEQQLTQLSTEQERMAQESDKLKSTVHAQEQLLNEKKQQVSQLSAEQERLAQESDKLKSTAHAQEQLLNEKEQQVIKLTSKQENMTDQLQELHVNLHQKEERVKFLLIQLKKLSQKRKELQVILHQKEKQVVQLQTATQIQQRDLDEKEQWIAQLKAEKDQKIIELQTSIEAKDQTIEQQKELIDRITVEKNQLNQVLYIIDNSLGWKLISKLYNIEEKLMPPGTSRRTIYDLVWKSIKTFFFQGWSSFIREAKNYFKARKELRITRAPVILPHASDPVEKLDNNAYLPQKCILVIDRWVPTYDQDSGSLRMYSIIKILNEIGYHVTLLPDDLKKTEPYTSELKQKGIDVVGGDIDIEEYLKKMGHIFINVIISRPEQALKYIPLIRAYAINSSIIYDTVDLHWVRLERAASVTGNNELLNDAKHYKSMELFSAKCSDITFTITNDEKKLLLHEIPELKIEVIPNIHEVIQGDRPFRKRKDIMFIGGFYHQPNEDAVFYFVREIFPIIHERITNIRFFIVGSNPSDDLLKLNSENIIVTGYVKDVMPYFRNCRVFVSPLRYGAGMKGKIGQSMSYGLPVITTTVGAEGIGLVDGENALIEDESNAFAEAVLRLYTDESLWNQISRQSLAHIENNYSKKVIQKKLVDVFNSLRKYNFYDESATPVDIRCAA